jgi:hypothetical protein
VVGTEPEVLGAEYMWLPRRSNTGAPNGWVERPPPNEVPRIGCHGPTHWRRERPEVGPESLCDQEWDERVAREVEHQARIEIAFDRADTLDRLGDFERALEWLDEADVLSGGLSPTYRAKRVRLAAEIGHR